MHDEVMNIDGCRSSLLLSSVHLSPPSTAISVTHSHHLSDTSAMVLYQACMLSSRPDLN